MCVKEWGCLCRFFDLLYISVNQISYAQETSNYCGFFSRNKQKTRKFTEIWTWFLTWSNSVKLKGLLRRCDHLLPSKFISWQTQQFFYNAVYYLYLRFRKAKHVYKHNRAFIIKLQPSTQIKVRTATIATSEIPVHVYMFSWPVENFVQKWTFFASLYVHILY